MDTNRDGILTNEQYQAEAAKTRRLVAEDVEIANSVEGLEHRIDVLESLSEWDRTPGLLESLKVRLEAAKAARHAEYVAGLPARDTAFAAEWTEEVTRARRAAWNAEVAKLPKGHGPAKIIAKLGFRMDDLKKAVALHNLTGR